MLQLSPYFKNTWIEGNFPISMWDVYSLDGPHTKNAEGWHFELKKLAGKPHPNIYKAVNVFKYKQAATDITLIQLAARRPSSEEKKVQNPRENN